MAVKEGAASLRSAPVCVCVCLFVRERERAKGFVYCSRDKSVSEYHKSIERFNYTAHQRDRARYAHTYSHG